MIRLAAIGAACAAFAGLGAASDVRTTLEDINKCTGITDPAQRLACYDGAAPKVRAALDVATDEDRVTLFGLDLFGDGGGIGGSNEATRPEDFGKRDLPKVETVQSGGVISEITVALADTGKNNAGREVYILDNGQVWRQKETKDMKLPRKVEGLRVKIRQGALGSYYLSREGQSTSVPVERVK